MSKRRTSSIRKEAGIAEQLIELKVITQHTGTIHEAQKQQLQLWGWLAVPHADRFEVVVALPHLAGTKVANRHCIEYRVDATHRPPRDLKRLLEGLDRSVKWLLGDDFTVLVTINGKAIFERKGRPRKQNLPKLIERLKHADTDRD